MMFELDLDIVVLLVSRSYDEKYVSNKESIRLTAGLGLIGPDY